MPDPTPGGRVTTSRTPPARNRFVYVVGAVAALGGLLFGFDTGIISSALLYVGREFDLGDIGKQLVVSSILVGAAVGALACGRLSERWGRRPTVLAVALVFAFGAIAGALAPSAVVLVVSRLLLGLAVGGASQIVPVYIAEIAPPRARGGMVAMFQLMITFGIMVSYLVGYLFSGTGGWRWMFGFGVIPAAVLLCGLFAMPESPRWLYQHRGAERARDALARVRTPEEVPAELETLARVGDGTDGGDWRALGRRWVRPALLVGLGAAIFCQLTGTNAVIYYAPTLLSQSGFGDSAAILTTVGVGCVFFVTTLLGIVLVDRIGRRRLLLTMLPGAGVCLIIVGVALLGGHPSGAGAWVVVLGLLGYIAFNGAGISTVAWLLPSEVFPGAVRGVAVSLTALTVWVFDLLVSLTALSLTNAIGTPGTFWLYGAVNVVAFVFFLRFLPETRGRSLEDIEQSLRDGTFRPRPAGQ